MQPVIVIPAYNPDEKLLALVKELFGKNSNHQIIIVDDGSCTESQDIFSALQELKNIAILKHEHNLGKGAALKTAFHYYLANYDEHSAGVVTVDADGQHAVFDICRVIAYLEHNPNKLCLGVRTFDKQTPWKSLLGNKFSRFIFWCSTRYHLKDTQSGLRGIPRAFLNTLLKCSAVSYDFELYMLILAIRSKIKIEQIPIETIYFNKNEGSHFDPFIDSLKITYVFLRFTLFSFLASLLDFVVFAASNVFTHNVLFSMTVGRLFGGTFNFFLGKRLTFKSRNEIIGEIVKFILLACFLLGASYGFVVILVLLGINVYAGKIISEVILFFLSFLIQRFIVFKANTAVYVVSKPTVTDWDKYYQTPPKFSSITRQFTINKLLRLIKLYQLKVATLCELGGANSCFFNLFRLNFPKSEYVIIDNNQIGLDLFKESNVDISQVSLIKHNLLLPFELNFKADVVLSIGLIEHFTWENTVKVIQRHFECAKQGAIVIISFPTPTFLYRTIRYFAELFHVWKFYDETPLCLQDVADECQKYGKVLFSTINWGCVLTQGIVVTRVIDESGLKKNEAGCNE